MRIAIPAYQDYALRAEIAKALAVAGSLKIGVAETYLSTGHFPNESEAQRLLEWAPVSDSVELAVAPDTGIISVYFTENATPSLTGSSLYLEPADDGGSLIWSCYSDEIQPQQARPKARRHSDDQSTVEFAIEYSGEIVHGLAFGIDRKHLRRLERGEIDFDRRVELHGSSSLEARHLLNNELTNASALGERCVLIVHGRGLHSEEGPVLKTAVIEWLTAPPLAARIMAFSSAPPADGGPGATGVLLRRKR